jgi:hypothetical protein
MRSIPLVQRKHSDGPEKGKEKFHDQELLIQIMRWVDPKRGHQFRRSEQAHRVARQDQASRNRLDLWRMRSGATCAPRSRRFPSAILDEDIHAALKAVLDAPQLKAEPSKKKER